MKIGIITWFSYENYGTKLQAVALQKYLKNIGYDVELINFLPPESLQVHIDNRTFLKKLEEIPKKIKAKVIKRKYNKYIKKRYSKMDSFISKNCNLTKFINNDYEYIKICNSFDLLICGSDQIWNPNFYHKYYYAFFDKIKTPKISYAPSLGINEVLPSVERKIVDSLKSFKYITAREKSGANLLAEITGKDVATVVDPTFLLSKDDWLEFIDVTLKEKEYVLCYFLSDNKNYWNASRKFCKKHNLEMYVIPQTIDSYQQSNHVLLDVGVDDFLKLVYNATYILTDSFHACVFSIIFQKQFYVFKRFNEDRYSSQNSRIINLLEDLSLSDRLIEYNDNLIKDKETINYSYINRILNKQIEFSKNQLDIGLGYSENK